MSPVSNTLIPKDNNTDSHTQTTNCSQHTGKIVKSDADNAKDARNVSSNAKDGLTYDLHCHSTRSDGTFSPTQVVEKAHQAGIDVLALTDHDTTTGITEANKVADELGIRLINGVEISCEHTLTGGYGKNQSVSKIIHVLGLDFSDRQQMSDKLNQLQDSRANRGRAIVAKLAEVLPSDFRLKKASHIELVNRLDFEDTLWQQVLAKAEWNPQAVGRSHIAKVLYEMGLVSTMQQAFDRYIADNKPAYVKIDALTMKQGVELIQACGGQAVLAHPTRYNLSSTRIRRLIAEFAQFGGDGCELPPIKEPLSKRRMVDREIASHGLTVSVGSDFHGSTMPWRRLGDVPRPTSTQIGVWERFH